ncbi:MAG TPA: hypothetical protein VN437_04830 [Rectinemataceae bacterium]|nr:hypothetical protein [Rectinemataceae bacterium]
MGEPTVGQQRNAQAPNAVAVPGDAADDASFLSPEEAETILSSLEAKDRLLLGPRESINLEEEGNFISPEDVEASEPGVVVEPPNTFNAPPTQQQKRRQSAPHSADALQSDLLTRIAGELRSIKTDLGSLKNTYDDMISKASSIASDRPAVESPPTAEELPEPAGQFIPEKSLEEIKSLLGYLDRLLESLPEEKIDEFARSEYFELYRKIFEFFSLV